MRARTGSTAAVDGAATPKGGGGGCSTDLHKATAALLKPGAAAGPDVGPAADALGLYPGLSDELAAQVSEI